MVASLQRTRDRVLDGARLQPGQSFLDVGTGTGLLAVGALQRLGEDGQVMAVDLSVDCLEELRSAVPDPRLWYLLGDAEVLPLPDDFVDAVATRSVLIYVRDKAEAAREFFRVLRPGGRVSIFEPINRRCRRPHETIDFGALHERVVAADEARYSRDDSMLDFDEQDLERCFGDAGFVELRSELRSVNEPIPVESLLHGQGAPGRPTLVERWRESFSAEEVERLVEAARAAGETFELSLPTLFLVGKKP